MIECAGQRTRQRSGRDERTVCFNTSHTGYKVNGSQCYGTAKKTTIKYGHKKTNSLDEFGAGSSVEEQNDAEKSKPDRGENHDTEYVTIREEDLIVKNISKKVP